MRLDRATLTYTANETLAGFSMSSDGSWSLDATNPAYQSLAQGSSGTYEIDYTVSDGQGGTDTATLTITVTGVNDNPVAVDDSGSLLAAGAIGRREDDVRVS